MERILLIVPPYLSFERYVHPDFNERKVIKKSGVYGSVVTDMPIGLISISAYLKKHASVEIRLIDFNTVLNRIEGFDYNSFLSMYSDFLNAKEYLDFAPTIIGISALFTPSYYNMLDIAKVAKDIFPKSLVVAGGGVPTCMYQQIYNDSDCFEGLCYGEGEKPLLDLVEALDKKKLLESHRSWITKTKVEAKESFEYDFIENLDVIPFYDYDILRKDEYGLSPTVSTFATSEGKYLFHMVTSRGCPYNCCFCSSYKVHGKKMRYHSLARVKKDLSLLAKKYAVKKIGFQDDNFMVDKKRALAIIDMVKELKMDVFFQSGLSIIGLDRKVLETIKNAGLNHLVLAVESGSQRVLSQIMHKPVDLAMVKQVIADCRDLQIDTDVNILIGLPGETKQDIEETCQFLKTLDATWFRIYIATPLVGSEMYEICVKKNYLKDSHIGSDFKTAVIETEDFTTEYIKEKAYSLNLELNFVGNSDLRLGNTDTALKGFENTIRIRDDHAFAYYFAAKCYQKIGFNEKYLVYKAVYHRIISESDFWKKLSIQFNLAEL